MIVSVTPNIALDVTYYVDALRIHDSHRVSRFAQRAGGKGINVSRVLNSLGYESQILGFVGGANGIEIQGELKEAGLTSDLVPIQGNDRRSITVVDEESGDATVFNEAGPTISADEWFALSDRIRQHMDSAKVLVVSGSFPPGVPDDACAQLVAIGVASSTPVIVDTVGSNLLAAAKAGASVLKPNGAEILAATGLANIVDAARKLVELGAEAVVVSQGPDGLYAVTENEAWRAVPPRQVSGNPTGAGDAAVAALAAGLSDQAPWPTVLAQAVAVSAAAVLHPLAGGFERKAYEEFRTTVNVEEVS